MISRFLLLSFLLLGVVFTFPAQAAEPVQVATAPELTADDQLKLFFEQETSRIEQASQQTLRDVSAWKEKQEIYRGQLVEMLGLSPWPEKTDLKVTITKEIEQDDIRVKNLHFQALPGLYVTGNLYLPKTVERPCPAILYVCGHSQNFKDGMSYGNKVGYHHYGVWFARNGYVCLTIDTVQLGEFMGVHHGTYSKDMWWWNARGYTPAGVETWNGIRGIDYLQSLPEVDSERIGVTGRSGGGGYSWYIAAVDTRVKAAVPVAGITSMRNHIVDGCIEGHCDCMFMLNSRGWDFAQVASLIAPRPLLLTNTDRDRIFPLDGVVDVFFKTRHVYDSLGAGGNLGLAISEGPHKDTQRSQVNACEWFNRFLKQDSSPIEHAPKRFENEELRVFHELPADERTSKIHDTFVPVAQPKVPQNVQEWKALQATWLDQLKLHSFPALPEEAPVSAPEKGATKTVDAIEITDYQFSPQAPLELKFQICQKQSTQTPAAVARVTVLLTSSADEAEWVEAAKGRFGKTADAVVCFSPRGLGVNAWTGDKKKQTHLRRRFALLGQTLDAWRVFDVCQLVRSLRQLPEYQNCELTIEGAEALAGIAVYAVLFEPEIQGLVLHQVPVSHQEQNAPVFLNVMRILDLPQALAMAAEICPIQLQQTDSAVLEYARAVQAVPEILLQLESSPAASAK